MRLCPNHFHSWRESPRQNGPTEGHVATMEISIVTPPGQSGSFTIGSRERGRSLEDLPERHLKLLDEPVTAGMACVNGNGTIHTSPVWGGRAHAEILLNSVRGRQ